MELLSSFLEGLIHPLLNSEETCCPRLRRKSVDFKAESEEETMIELGTISNSCPLPRVSSGLRGSGLPRSYSSKGEGLTTRQPSWLEIQVKVPFVRAKFRRRPGFASANFHIQSVMAARGGAAHLSVNLYGSRGRFSSGRNVFGSRAFHEFFGAFNFL